MTSPMVRTTPEAKEPTTTSGREILVLAEQDQRGTDRLRVRFRALDPSSQEDALWEFVGALARHELVEEVVLCPSSGAGAAGGGSGLADVRVLPGRSADGGASAKARRGRISPALCEPYDPERSLAHGE